MEHTACWSKIPYELALCIFQNVTQELDYNQQKQNLANFQLVCKSWKSPAQRLLYDEIIVSEDHHGLAISTIERHATTIGPLVRKVKFKDSINGYAGFEEAFDILADGCPNIEELFSENRDEKHYILSKLLLTTKFGHLKRIDEDLHFRQVLPIYPFAAFKYRETLTEIYIDHEDNTGDYDSKEMLISELGQFASLKRVIVTLFMVGSRMEEIVDNLRDTVDTLVIQHTQEDGNWRALDYNKVVPNTSIKKLSIAEGARHGPFHTEYYKFKFKALECFESTLTDLQWEEADIPYLNFILSIDTYNVNITIGEDARTRIDRLIKHAAKKETYCKNKEFELDFDYMPPPPTYDDPSPYAQYKWNLDLIKTKRSNSVKLHYIRENTDDDPLERAMFMNDVSNWLALYSPSVVRIYNIEPMADHYIFLLENQHRPEFSTVAYVRRYFAWLCRDKSWQLLNDAISALIGKKGYVLSIGEMVLCDEPASNQLMLNQPETVDYISRVEIRKSLIHHKLLSLLSRKLPRMDTLMIDSSWILMDDDMYTLKIFLPSTRLRRIGIVIAPFNYGTGEQTDRIILDNERLLEATSDNGRYILKIESAKERYMSYRKGNENIGNVDRDKDITKGTEQDFLIWIQCEHVEEFTIVSGLDEDVNWQPTFENVDTMR